MKIVITGASGVIGSWIAHTLSEDNEVIAYIQDSSSAVRIASNPKIIIRRSEQNCTWKDLLNIDIPEVLILCDWMGVGSADRNSLSQRTNIARQAEMVKGSAKIGVKTVIGLGSQAELGRVTSIVREDASDNPLTEYAKAKVECREILSDLCKEEGVNFYWARIFSAYGLMDSEKWLIPSLISALRNKRRFKMTDGSQTWSYLNFIDIAIAIEMIIKSKISSRIVNIGNPNTNTIREIAERIEIKMGATGKIDFGSMKIREDQTKVMIPHCGTLNSLGWRPMIRFEDGIDEILKWQASDEIFSVTIFKDREVKIPGYAKYREHSREFK
jgi:UDP-glucose 4-epimerase